jgi:hypothetical protein
MDETQDLRRLCLLAAAGNLAYQANIDKAGVQDVQQSMRCVLYMLVAFSLRRRNLGRRDLRTDPANPNRRGVPRSYTNPSRLRFSVPNWAAFRARMRKRLASLFIALPHKRGCPAITYM